MNGPRREPSPSEPAEPIEPTDDDRCAEEDEDLDLDIEEADDGERLKEGFTGQER